MRERALAKLLHDENTSRDRPVWEITDRRGNTFYVERKHVEGHIPIGTKSYQIFDNQMIVEVEVANPYRENQIRIYKECEGYFAPLEWYKKI